MMQLLLSDSQSEPEERELRPRTERSSFHLANAFAQSDELIGRQRFELLDGTGGPPYFDAGADFLTPGRRPQNGSSLSPASAPKLH